MTEETTTTTVATPSISPEKPELVTMKLFLEQIAPDKTVQVATKGYVPHHGAKQCKMIALPDIYLYCGGDECRGLRFFTTRKERISFQYDNTEHTFITYVCKNCGFTHKTFCVRATLLKEEAWASIVKFGEIPAFGPPTPARLVTLLGSEKDYFFKGRRCEIQGLGIGAFTYYRRIIEAKRNSIFDEIIRVSETLGADSKLIAELKAAKKETQFSNAIDKIKHAIPQALLISGHNPLLLLHSALSEGLHAKTDAECLGLATDIRIVLTEFVEKMAQAMKDDAQLNDAVSNLLKIKSQRVQKASSE